MNLRFYLLPVSMCVACHSHGQLTTRDDYAPSMSGTVSERVPGCYELANGEWQTDKSLAAFYPLQYLPRRIFFDTTRLKGWDPLQTAEYPMWAIRSRPLPTYGSGPFVFWSRVRNGADTILVGAPLAMGGARMMLWPVIDGFAGTLTTFTDAIPPDGVAHASAPIRLRRSTCGDSESALGGAS